MFVCLYSSVCVPSSSSSIWLAAWPTCQSYCNELFLFCMCCSGCNSFEVCGAVRWFLSVHVFSWFSKVSVPSGSFSIWLAACSLQNACASDTVIFLLVTFSAIFSAHLLTRAKHFITCTEWHQLQKAQQSVSWGTLMSEDLVITWSNIRKISGIWVLIAAKFKFIVWVWVVLQSVLAQSA